MCIMYNRGENCLHLLARHPRENAAAIFHMLIQVAPGFPINKQDSSGNTGITRVIVDLVPPCC